MTDDASAKVSDANAGEKSRMADREGHGAVNSSHDRASGPAKDPRPEDKHGYGYRVVTVGEAVERAVSASGTSLSFSVSSCGSPHRYAASPIRCGAITRLALYFCGAAQTAAATRADRDGGSRTASSGLHPCAFCAAANRYGSGANQPSSVRA